MGLSGRNNDFFCFQSKKDDPNALSLPVWCMVFTHKPLKNPPRTVERAGQSLLGKARGFTGGQALSAELRLIITCPVTDLARVAVCFLLGQFLALGEGLGPWHQPHPGNCPVSLPSALCLLSCYRHSQFANSLALITNSSCVRGLLNLAEKDFIES